MRKERETERGIDRRKKFNINFNNITKYKHYGNMSPTPINFCESGLLTP